MTTHAFQKRVVGGRIQSLHGESCSMSRHSPKASHEFSEIKEATGYLSKVIHGKETVDLRLFQGACKKILADIKLGAVPDRDRQEIRENVLGPLFGMIKRTNELEMEPNSEAVKVFDRLWELEKPFESTRAAVLYLRRIEKNPAKLDQVCFAEACWYLVRSLDERKIPSEDRRELRNGLLDRLGEKVVATSIKIDEDGPAYKALLSLTKKESMTPYAN